MKASKFNYEEPIVEIFPLCESDVITTSAFNGEDDEIGADWTNG